MRMQSVVKGVLTFVPGMSLVMPGKSPGHTDSAQYCYSVWLKHLTMLSVRGMHSVPPTVAELGPGETIGVGLAALLCGADHYVSLDAVAHTCVERNLAVFEPLVALFKSRAPRPDKGWPDFDQHLDARLFPSHVLTEELLERTLAPQRLDEIRGAIRHGKQGSISISTVAPWESPAVIDESSIDLVFSHSVLEHVTDLPRTYQALYQWLRPGGGMSHQIDFKSHGLTAEWNGYRAHSELLWKVILGRRPYLINREPCSLHLQLMREAGFEITCELKNHRTDGIPRSRLSQRWASLSEDDHTCSGVFVQARKPMQGELPWIARITD